MWSAKPLSLRFEFAGMDSFNPPPEIETFRLYLPRLCETPLSELLSVGCQLPTTNRTGASG